MFVNVNTYTSQIWPDCATRILEENQYTTTEETCPSQFTVPGTTEFSFRPFWVGLQRYGFLIKDSVRTLSLQSELPRPIKIRPRMYVRRSIMYEKAAFCSPEENSSVAR